MSENSKFLEPAEPMEITESATIELTKSAKIAKLNEQVKETESIKTAQSNGEPANSTQLSELKSRAGVVSAEAAVALESAETEKSIVSAATADSHSSTEVSLYAEVPASLESAKTESAVSDESGKPDASAKRAGSSELAGTSKSNQPSGTSESSEPPRKKAKVAEAMDSFINDILNSTKSLQAIMSEDYLNPVPYTKVYVGQVKNVKDLSKIILTLNEKIPLKDLNHLKRACRKEVLLFPVTYLKKQDHTSIRNYIEEHVNELQNCFEYFKTLDVPAIGPKLRKQYVECCRTWSVNFHPDKYLEKLYNSELFTLQELDDHRLFMSMAFEVARYYLSQKNPNLKPSDILKADLNATVVVDPTDQTVVAVAFDNRVNHPIQHSVMLAIDNVAKTQTGGVWLKSTDIYSENLRGIGSMELILHLKKKYPAVKFGAKDYLTKSELDERNLNASECPYLCTEYYVYVIREPCVMCSMGLVHARANRVFFYKKHDMGALGTKTKLHCVSSLNHRYEVFTDFV